MCVLCTVRPATTRDHVPPKGLFKGLGVDLITVPACRICNNGSSSDDEDLRFYISALVGKQTSGSAKLWDEGAHKSFKRKTKLRESVLKSAHEVKAVDRQGRMVTRLAFKVPVQVYQRVFERTTRGLYYFHTGKMLPALTLVDVNVLVDFIELDAPETCLLTKRTIGQDACVYRYGIDEGDMNSSIWLYEFYGSHWVQVATGSFSKKAAF